MRFASPMIGWAKRSYVRLARLWMLRFTSLSVSTYNSSVFILILKILYFFLLVVFFYLNIAFTAVVSFLKLSFFGL